jgi:Acetyltransferase (GNAT) domain
MRSVFAGARGSPSRLDGVWYLVSSSRPWPSGVRIIAMSDRTPSSPTMRSTRAALDCRIALQLQSEFDEERRSSREVVDDDADVVHPLDRPAPRVGAPLVGVIHDDLLSGRPPGSAARMRVQARWRSFCCCMSSSMAVGLLPLPPENQDLEIGWQLPPDVWSQGYASQTTYALAQWAFNQDTDEIFAVVRPDNTRAAATVAQRHGMGRRDQQVLVPDDR